MEEHFEEIVEFAGIRNFLDSPIKNYSSGMKARLGFAVATMVDPEILIVDEADVPVDFGSVTAAVAVTAFHWAYSVTSASAV